MSARTPKLSKNLEDVGYTVHRIDLYRQAARDLRASDSGISRYLIDIFGEELIGSLACAIDPYRQFHNDIRKVSLLTDGPKIVRSRTKVTSPLRQRKEKIETNQLTYSYYPNTDAGIFVYAYTGPTPSSTVQYRNFSDQEKLYGFCNDTIRRTRPINHIGGEFEYFSPKITSTSRSMSWLVSDNLNFNSIGNGQRAQVITRRTVTRSGPEFTCTNASIQALVPAIRARALDVMSKNVLSMLDQVQPRHKTFDLVRQIAELRDLPRTLQGTLEIWRSFERLVGTDYFRALQRTASNWRDPDLLRSYSRNLGHHTGFRFSELETLDQNASSAFLTFKFGWEAMVRGIVQFLPSPGRVTLEVNHLINSIGRDRSRRTRKSWSEPETSFPNFLMQLLDSEIPVDSVVKRRGIRNIELRLVANFNIRFPPLEIPRLRRSLFLRRIGAEPSPSDLYELIPWTWLADWFTGAGDYVQLMDSISNDDSIINYGFLTFREECTITPSVRGKFRTTVRRTIDGIDNVNESFSSLTHEGKLKLIYHLRRSIPSLTNVRSYWGSLNPNQAAILGALVSTRSGGRGTRIAS